MITETNLQIPVVISWHGTDFRACISLHNGHGSCGNLWGRLDQAEARGWRRTSLYGPELPHYVETPYHAAIDAEVARRVAELAGTPPAPTDPLAAALAEVARLRLILTTLSRGDVGRGAVVELYERPDVPSGLGVLVCRGEGDEAAFLRDVRTGIDLLAERLDSIVLPDAPEPA